MSDPRPDNQGYEDYYLQVNPPSKANYRKKARGYQRRFGKLLDAANPASVLDLGCGTGMFTSYLAGRDIGTVVGVDLNAALVEVARENVPDAEFVVDDAVHYAQTCNRSFDVVFLLDLLEHVPRENIVPLLRAVRECVADDGFVLVRTPNLNSLHAAGSFYVDFTHVTPFTERSLVHVAKLAGFERVEHCRQFGMQNFKGKVKACINHVLGKMLVWLRGGHSVKVFYRNLVTKLYR